MTPHRLEVAGDPQDGGWYCARCTEPFAYAIDARTHCPGGPVPWTAERQQAFRRRVRRMYGGRRDLTCDVQAGPRGLPCRP